MNFKDELYNKTLEELIDELYKHPFYTHNHMVVKDVIAERLKDKPDYDKYLVCFPSKFSPRSEQLHLEQDMHSIRGLVEWDRVESLMEDEYSLIPFSDLSTFIEDERFGYVERYMAEYDLGLKQLVVACYITDGKNVMLLDCKQGRMAGNYTMVQGHVEYDPTIYFKSQLEFLRDNAFREFSEELKLSKEIIFPLTPKFLYNGEIQLVQLEHFGIIYEVRVENLNEYIHNITSGEPEKHTPVCISLKDTADLDGKIDNWASVVLKHLREH